MEAATIIMPIIPGLTREDKPIVTVLAEGIHQSQVLLMSLINLRIHLRGLLRW